MDLAAKSDGELDQMIENHVVKSATGLPVFHQLLKERSRRSQLTQRLDLEKSPECLKDAARRGVCVAYADLANASGVEWSKARHQMNCANGHLDRLLDLCKARDLPLLTAICVNQTGVSTGELEDEALAGFITGAKRLGLLVTDERAFHHQCRDACSEWGRRRGISA